MDAASVDRSGHADCPHDAAPDVSDLALDAIAAGGNMTTSEAEGWQSIAAAAGMALVAVGLPRVFKGELVVADDGIARRFRALLTMMWVTQRPSSPAVREAA